ncbi:competence protein TfoX [Parvimonas micra]|nr:competence protein TfoX [Parvimonas micra]WBB33685.1 competence protein TfoX [Parvimonas micra]WBB35206.1 competence protein TfoX [Parvimonas micra]
MMGEYIIYYKEKVTGGIYDDRFLVKATKKAIDYVSDVQFQLPYEGAKEMLLVDDVEDKMYLKGLFETMYNELPFRKVKK